MSRKYADLPDIDASQDVYETLSPPSSPILKDEEDLDEAHIRALRLEREKEKEAERERRRAGARLAGEQQRKVPLEELEEIDWGTGVGVEEGKKRWRKRERRGPKKTDITATFELDETPVQRFARLQLELAELEDHVAQQRQKKAAVHADKMPEGEARMIHSLLELRERLGKLEEGGMLVEVDDEEPAEEGDQTKENGDAHPHHPPGDAHGRRASTSSEKGHEKDRAVEIVALDRRLAQLEHLLGANTVSPSDPHPAPLVPTISRLSTQLSLLSQPRHLDAVSRRLKTLLSDLERYDQHVHPAHASSAPGGPTPWNTATATTAAAVGRSRQPTGGGAAGQGQEERPMSQSSQAQLMHFLNRLDPLLPTLPALLLRLRTLSALHASASTFSSRLREAEEREKAMESALEELEGAVQLLERGLDENKQRVEGNVKGLEDRVVGLVGRLEALEGGRPR